MTQKELLETIEEAARTGATTLSLSGNQLTALPPEIVQLTGLTTLYLDNNQLTALPPEIVQLTGLTTLSLSGNQLTALPPEIVQLTGLTTLYLHNNQLTALPPEIVQLTGLTTLSLSGNQLTALPPEIGQLTGLTTLSLSGNQLTALPPEIVQLTGLTTLYLHNNQLTALPPEIVQLTGLTTLYLSGNQLTALPPEIGQLTGLTYLDLRGNPLPVLPEILENVYNPQGILSAYFNPQQTAGRPLCEAKMLIVGEGFAGKTSLRRALMGESVNPDELKTDGIEIKNWKFPLSGDEIRVNVWDFGGQEVMHATHQFFLTERSLYLLVLNARQDASQNRLEYWLKMIQTFGGNAPVLVVINKSEEHPLLLDQDGLEVKYPNIKGFFYTAACPQSPKQQQGIDALRDAVKHEIDGLENLRYPLPASWFAVKEHLETLKRDYISLDEYKALCQTEKVPAEGVAILLSLLHELGTALNYQRHKRFDIRDTSVLNPEWVTRGVYRILNYLPKVARKQATLTRDLLPKLLDTNHYLPEKYPFLLGMMEQFEICYCMDGEKESEYLFPDLLLPSEPDTGDWGEKLMFEYHYKDVWIPSIMTRFIVRMSGYISQNTVWRKGVLLRHEGMRAIVKVDPEEKQLVIWIEGLSSRRREFLAIIRREFEVIHNSFEALRFTEEVPMPDNPKVYVGYKHLLTLEDLRQETYIPEGMRTEINVRDLLNGIVSQEERYRDRLQGREHKMPKTPKPAEPAPIPQIQQPSQPLPPPKKETPWASKSFYLFAFIVIIGASALVANYLSWTAVPAVFVIGLLGLGVIGAFQLRHDNRLNEKNFLELMIESYKRIPLLGGKKTHDLPDKTRAVVNQRSPKTKKAIEEKDTAQLP